MPLCLRSGGQLHVVVCSLYLRCVETAVEAPKEALEHGMSGQVCKKLGPRTKLLLDHSHGAQILFT